MKVDSKSATKVGHWVLDKAIDGVPPLTSASDLAQEYRIHRGYIDDDARVRALVRWETSKNFTTGFLTGLGGIVTLPLAVPAALGAAWIVQARMAGAIADLYGHDLHNDQVRTFVLLSICGDGAKEVIKDVGVQIGKKSLEQAIKQVPGRVLIEINKKVGFRLLTKAGEKGIINLIKIVPVAGGIVGGTFDGATCYAVGRTAKKIFKLPEPSTN